MRQFLAMRYHGDMKRLMSLWAPSNSKKIPIFHPFKFVRFVNTKGEIRVKNAGCFFLSSWRYQIFQPTRIRHGRIYAHQPAWIRHRRIRMAIPSCNFPLASDEYGTFCHSVSLSQLTAVSDALGRVAKYIWKKSLTEKCLKDPTYAIFWKAGGSRMTFPCVNPIQLGPSPFNSSPQCKKSSLRHHFKIPENWVHKSSWKTLWWQLLPVSSSARGIFGPKSPASNTQKIPNNGRIWAKNALWKIINPPRPKIEK